MSDPSSSQETLVGVDVLRLQRCLGDTELSYFLPSRESGVNDMYLHLGFHAPAVIMERKRVCMVWAILRARHPLLASSVKMYNYEDVRFVFSAPTCVQDALANADGTLEYRSQNKDDLIDSYLNGSRTLSNERLSYLIVSCADTANPDVPGPKPTVQSYELLICATHFLGDGMALHQFANDFFGILGSSQTNEELSSVLNTEIRTRYAKFSESCALPSSIEDRLPHPPSSRFARAAARVDFQRSQEKFIGGHSFPRRLDTPRHTIVPTAAIDEERTKKILKKCKSRGVSISSALFAICNIAWAKTTDQKWELPIMMYSALNLRPYLMDNTTLNDSYWYLAIGYFNVVLPAFFPSSGDLTSTFWHRAISAKIQSTHAAKNPLVISRSREMARERGERARAWGKEDDDKVKGPWKAPVPSHKPPPNKPPSTALLGLSLLGNLDATYKHGNFSDIRLHTLTTGSRQRSGGMLLFGYTFVGKLWISLGYDENGFDRDIVVKFWDNVLSSIDDLLLA